MKTRGSVRPWWLLRPVRMHAAWWFAAGALFLAVGRITGLDREFPVAYVIPVSLAAWYSGRLSALALAVLMPLAHLQMILPETPPENLAALVGMAAFRGSVIAIMALWFARLSEHERALNHELQVLKDLLPICSFCKSIRNDSGEWEALEQFISRRSETRFSHGVCSRCLETHYPAFQDEHPHAARRSA
ncbi:MAG: hypothetical protein AB7F99_12745 [Vicinamibacterales bacterium]